MGVSRSYSRGAISAANYVALAIIFSVASLHGQPLGKIVGRVSTSAVGLLPPLTVTTNQDVCGQEVPNESLFVDASGGLANAVVTVVGLPAGEVVSPTITNAGCQFSPRVQLGRPGGEIQITSIDEVLHTSHAYADDNRSLFNVAIPIPGLTITRQLTARGVIRLVCDTHTWMRGFVIASTDLSAVTTLDGAFVLDNIPAGTYDIRIWHEYFGVSNHTVTVEAEETAAVTYTLHKMDAPNDSY